MHTWLMWARMLCASYLLLTTPVFSPHNYEGNHTGLGSPEGRRGGGDGCSSAHQLEHSQRGRRCNYAAGVVSAVGARGSLRPATAQQHHHSARCQVSISRALTGACRGIVLAARHMHWCSGPLQDSLHNPPDHALAPSLDMQAPSIVNYSPFAHLHPGCWCASWSSTACSTHAPWHTACCRCTAQPRRFAAAASSQNG